MLALNVFDQIRYMAGLLVANQLVANGTVPRRSHFYLRALLGFIVCIFISLGYLLIVLFYEKSGNIIVFGVIGWLWWFSMSLLGIAYIVFCYDIKPCNAFFKGSMGAILQHIVTIILRYWIVGTLFPKFPEAYPVWYVLVTAILYTAVYLLVYFLFIKKLKRSGKFTVAESKKTLVFYVIFFVLLSVVSSLVGGVFDWLIGALENYPDLNVQKVLLQYFCIGVSLLFCFSVFFFQFGYNSINALRAEKDFSDRLMRERIKQYESSKSNIEIINKKCHDLKYQILAIENKNIETTERVRLLEEAKNALMIYDCAVNTDNETLNTILNEKSLFCAEQGIRLSCTIKTAQLDKINVVDLFTMLGNMLDNAIEAVSMLNDEKKTISFSIDVQGGLLCIETQNYYSGDIEMEDDLPKTKKHDSEFHGIGLKSIREIAQKYGGFIQFETENSIFVLRVVIPI